MKKLSAILVCLLLCSLFLTACGLKPLEQPDALPEDSQQTPDKDGEQEEKPENQPEDKPEQKPEENPPEEQTPEFEPEQAPEKSAVLESREPLDETGVLWYIPNARMEQGLMQNLYLVEDGLLLTGSVATESGAGLSVSILSLETGEVLKETILTGMEMPDVQLCGDTIAVTDWLGSGIVLMNGDLEITDQMNVDKDTGAAYFSPDLKTLYCFASEEGILKQDLSSGNEVFVLEDAAGLYAGERCGDTVSFSYTDRVSQRSRRGILDLVTGDVILLPFDGAFNGVEYSDGIWLAGLMDDNNAWYLGREERPMEFVTGGEGYSSVSMLDEPSRLLITNYGETGQSALKLYDTDGSFISSCVMPEVIAQVNGDPVWSQRDGGYYISVIENSGKDMLLFWDLSAPISGESLQLAPAYSEETLSGTALPQELYDRAAALSDTYGVTVLIGDLCRTEVNEFDLSHELDAGYVSAGLDTLEAVLAAYPDGFMEQLVYGSFHEVEINLVGALKKTDMEGGGTGFTSFVGVTSELEGKNVIAVNIAQPGSVAQTMHHEIMHVIDHKLIFDASMRAEAVYSEEGWLALNPEGFAYAEDYHNLPADIWSDGYDRWFVEIYSRTYSKEDRATIMEFAMVNADWVFSASPGRLAKLSYLSECIRDAFDTTGWPAQTVWEKTLTRCGG